MATTTNRFHKMGARLARSGAGYGWTAARARAWAKGQQIRAAQVMAVVAGFKAESRLMRGLGPLARHGKPLGGRKITYLPRR